MASDHAGLDIFVVQSDGIHMLDDLVLVAAIGIDDDRVRDAGSMVSGRDTQPAAGAAKR